MILDRKGNWAVIQLPGRQFPAFALQGDTLSTWLSSLRVAEREYGSENSRDELREVLKEVQRAIDWYGAVLKRDGIRVPF
ncbi:MAG: hypothetical protein SF069_00405 [Phycisphaerae bacterium]|nr:hypothetical protein [Phycisphaerae bacterium]